VATPIGAFALAFDFLWITSAFSLVNDEFQIRRAARCYIFTVQGTTAIVIDPSALGGCHSRVAGVAELVDAPDLGSGGENRGGSSPSARTKLDRCAIPHGFKGGRCHVAWPYSKVPCLT
jgi:hypothetical protein